MRFPSPDKLLRGAGLASLRFPFVLAAALFAGVCAAALVGHSEQGLLLRGLMSAQLGIPLLFALRMLGERGGRLSLPLSLAGVAMLVVYFFALPDHPLGATWIRFVQFNVIAHLLVAWLPYFRRGEATGFWQFNKAIFLRLLNSLIFTGVLVIGLNVAMLALDKLFGLEINSNHYGRLDLILLFVFNTWHFLGGVPSDFAKLDRSRDFPRVLKIFAQYILAPLVAVYLALLTAYLVKVLVTAEWPSGWIGWLVSSVAAAGLFSLVLLHPLVEQKENRWISIYARIYFIMMLPAIGMQFMAIGKRIAQYGWTEPRYFLVVLTLWLLGVSIAGALNRLKRLEPLPTTLCLIALLSSFAPWGAYGVARGSQVGRLAGQLETAGLLTEGLLVSSGQSVDPETNREISAILDYLMENHGSTAVEGLLSARQGAEMAALADSTSKPYERHKLSERFMAFAGLDYQADWRRQADLRRRANRGWYFVERERGGEALALEGFSHLIRFDINHERVQEFTLYGLPLKLAHLGGEITLTGGGKTLLTLPLEPLLASLRDHVDTMEGVSAPSSLLAVSAATESLQVHLLLNSIRWEERDDGPWLQQLSGSMLMEP